MSKDGNVNNQGRDLNLEHSISEVELIELMSIILNGKWLILIVTTLFSIAAIIYAIQQPNIYKSSVLLAPAEAQNVNGMSSLAGQLGGLASLAGVNLGGNGSDKTQLALEVLKSRQFIASFIEKHKILPNLMAVHSWERSKNSIIYNLDIYKKGRWIREETSKRPSKPTAQEAYKVFINQLKISPNKETGMINISYEHISPFIAQAWVNWLIIDINQEMKKRDVIEANKSIEFLTEQLEKTKIADIRSILYKLIEEQAKTIMFANVRNEYVFKTIDPAIIPEEKDKPRRALIVIIGMLLGSMLSIVFVFFRHYVKNNIKPI